MSEMHYLNTILIVLLLIQYKTFAQETTKNVESYSTICNTTTNQFISMKSSSTVKTTQITPQRKAFERAILRRRTRFIMYPKRSVVAITIANGKSIEGGQPRGYVFVIELDTITAVPDSLDGWKPTILFKRLEAEKQATAVIPKITLPPPTQAPLLESHPETLPPLTFDALFPSHEYFHHDYYPAIENWEHHPHYFDGEYETHSPYDSPISEDFIRRLYNPSNNKRPVETHKSFYSSYRKPSINDRISKTHTKNSNSRHRRPQQEKIHDSSKFSREWTYSNGYRERREVFNKLEAIGKIFKFDVKSCVQRLMCELRNCLKPYGESLMEDILRIILTVPRHSQMKEKFDYLDENNSIRHCATFFRKSCPYKILDFFKLPTNNKCKKT